MLRKTKLAHAYCTIFARIVKYSCLTRKKPLREFQRLLRLRIIWRCIMKVTQKEVFPHADCSIAGVTVQF
jgi:hypothetical protein